MFRILGKSVRRAWPLVLAAWLILLVGTWYAAPPWDKATEDREFAFLPANSPSRRAEKVFAEAFPQDGTGSNVVLVLHRDEDERGKLTGDLKFISDKLEPGIRRIAEKDGGLAYEIKASDEPLFPGDDEPTKPTPSAKRSIIARVRTPNTPGAGALLVSPDGQALLVVVDLTTEFLSAQNWRTIDAINELLGELRAGSDMPPGLQVAVTGSAVIGRDHTTAELQSVRATMFLTVVMVVVLLILIYRAPLLALIPLATVAVAVQISLNILALFAKAGYLTLFQGLQIYVTILAYGAGIDYCLFLTARYKEELDHGNSPPQAAEAAVGNVGAALTASAATVMCGIGMMYFAQFGKFQEAGIAIPLTLLLVLCATLTFSPALLRLAGRWAFWPQRIHQEEGLPSDTPAKSWRAFFAEGGMERIWDWIGHFLLRRAGAVWLTTVAIMAPFAILGGLLYNQVTFDVISNLPADSSSQAGTRLLQEHFPAGIVGTASILLVDPHMDFSSIEGRAVVEKVTDQLRERKDELGLADVRSLTSPLGITAQAGHDYSGLDAPAEVRRESVEREAKAHYIAGLGNAERTATRLDLVLNHSPFTRKSIEDLNRVEQAVKSALPADVRPATQLYVVGATADVRDLANVMGEDRTRIEVLVLAGVFLILIVLLRRFAIPLYLLLSVLFSYYTTLGVSFIVFYLLDPHGFTGIDWKIAIFLFAILIAVGEDYNIFLMTRIDEEERNHKPLNAITQALDRTGPIISSCGVIMAGTFASLLGGSLTEMKQLGFALAFGILLDTFVVRPILVPAFLILLRSGRIPWLHWAAKGSPIRAGEPGVNGEVHKNSKPTSETRGL
jgi:putative drug exporter of the RND superfamily